LPEVSPKVSTKNKNYCLDKVQVEIIKFVGSENGGLLARIHLAGFK